MRRRGNDAVPGGISDNHGQSGRESRDGRAQAAGPRGWLPTLLVISSAASLAGLLAVGGISSPALRALQRGDDSSHSRTASPEPPNGVQDPVTHPAVDDGDRATGNGGKVHSDGPNTQAIPAAVVRRLQESSSSPFPSVTGEVPLGYNASAGIPLDVWWMYAEPNATARAAFAKTIPTNIVRVYFAASEGFVDAPNDRFIYEVATIDSLNISSVHCTPVSCTVRYHVPETGDDYGPVQSLIATYGSLSIMKNFVRRMTRPIVLLADARVKYSRQNLAFHPTIYAHCARVPHWSGED